MSTAKATTDDESDDDDSDDADSNRNSDDDDDDDDDDECPARSQDPFSSILAPFDATLEPRCLA